MFVVRIYDRHDVEQSTVEVNDREDVAVIEQTLPSGWTMTITAA